MVGDANGVLCKGRIVVAIGTRDRAAETLQIIMRHFVGIGPQRSEFHSGFLRFEREGIDLERIKEVLTTLLAGKIIVEPGEQRIDAKLPRIAAGIKAER